MPNLKVRVLMTQECHVGCDYCYCDRADHCVMDERTIDRIAEVSLSTKNKYGFRDVKYAISGGDVFLKKNLPRLQYAVDRFKKVTRNIRCAGVNQHHDEEVIDFIIKNRLPTLVSTDIDEGVDKILESAKKLHKHGLLFDCNIVLNNLNAPRVLEIAEAFLKEGLPVRPMPYYNANFNTVTLQDVENYFDLLERYNYRHINACWFTLNPWRTKCIGGSCGFGSSIFIVTPNGSILSCYVVQLDKRNEPIGKPAGTVWEDDPIALIKTHVAKFGYDGDLHEDCKVCEYVSYCQGGCHANKFYVYENFSGTNKAPYCEMTKYAIKRMKKLYSKLDWSEIEKLGWKVSQEERGSVPIDLSSFVHVLCDLE